MKITGPSSLLIVGASTRAAASSAVRAGLQPVCADQFADRDLRALTDIHFTIDDQNQWLEEILKREPVDWIYTGAVENRPDLINSISQRHTLNGNAGESLKNVRDPFFLQELLVPQSIRISPCLPADTPPSSQQLWLCKLRRSAAGQGICFSEQYMPDAEEADQYYLQQFQPGTPLSALFIAFEDRCVLIGTAMQLVGNRLLHATGFQFCGGMTLTSVPREWRSPLESLGQTIARGCRLKGLFGCDLIWNPEHQPGLWLTEVNPRYTALTELFELQFRLPLLRWHLAACHSHHANSTLSEFSASELVQQLESLEKQRLSPISKGILYSPADLTAPELPLGLPPGHADWQIPAIADIPDPGTSISVGTPVCTVYGTGGNPEKCLAALAGQILRCRRLIQPELACDLGRQEARNMLWPGKESEKLFFPGFFSSGNVSGSFLED